MAKGAPLFLLIVPFRGGLTWKSIKAAFAELNINRFAKTPFEGRGRIQIFSNGHRGGFSQPI
jgi:hypothetical protein